MTLHCIIFLGTKFQKCVYVFLYSHEIVFDLYWIRSSYYQNNLHYLSTSSVSRVNCEEKKTKIIMSNRILRIVIISTLLSIGLEFEKCNRSVACFSTTFRVECFPRYIHKRQMLRLELKILGFPSSENILTDIESVSKIVSHTLKSHLYICLKNSKKKKTHKKKNGDPSKLFLFLGLDIFINKVNTFSCLSIH